MNDETRRLSELATRMNGFGLAYVAEFPTNGVAMQRFNTLNDLVIKIGQYSTKLVQERGSASAIAEEKKGLRDAIRRSLKNIRATAISVEAQMPGTSQKFNLPTSQSDESLLETARAFLASATELKPVFLGREMPENFLEVLAGQIERFEGAINNHNLHKGERAAASALLDDVCSRVISLRRELDPMVRNKYHNDPEKLALWETASHLERRSRRGAGNGSNNAPPPTNGGQS